MLRYLLCGLDKVDKLVKLKKEFDLEISIDVAIVVEKDELPAIYMDSEVVKFVAGKFHLYHKYRL